MVLKGEQLQRGLGTVAAGVHSATHPPLPQLESKGGILMRWPACTSGGRGSSEVAADQAAAAQDAGTVHFIPSLAAHTNHSSPAPPCQWTGRRSPPTGWPR